VSKPKNPSSIIGLSSYSSSTKFIIEFCRISSGFLVVTTTRQKHNTLTDMP
jgi:hypothetical protein